MYRIGKEEADELARVIETRSMFKINQGLQETFKVEEKLRILLDAVETSKTEIGSPAIKEAIKKVVPTFREPEQVNRDAHNSEEMKNTLTV